MKISALLFIVFLAGCATNLDSVFECGIDYSDKDLRWTELNNKPENYDDLLILEKDGATAYDHLNSLGNLRYESWFTRENELMICRFTPRDQCLSKAKIAVFAKSNEWQLIELNDVVCFS